MIYCKVLEVLLGVKKPWQTVIAMKWMWMLKVSTFCDYTVEYEHLGFKYLRSEFPHLNSGNFLNHNPWRINKSHTKPYLIEATEQATTAV